MLQISAPGVLLNDTDPEGAPLTATNWSSPSHHALFGSWATGKFEYKPASGFIGTDSFTYTASDGEGGTATATVTIEVVAPDVAPLLQDDSYDVVKDTALSIPAPGVLGNDDLGQGQWPAVMTGTTNPAHGTLQWNPDGSFEYTPDAGFTGVDTFDYQVTWRTEQFSATVTLTVSDAPAEPQTPETPETPAGANETPALPGPREEQLAATGGDPSAALSVALGILTLGAVLTAARRRRRA